MSRACGIWFLLCFLLPSATTAEEDAGIRFETDFQAGLERAAREGRPVLFAINALENEFANNRLASQLYRSASWGRATREYVCFACNGNTHGDGTNCTRYPGIPCRAHKDALNYVIRRFGADLISPQHIVLEPDGGLAFRKEYYTQVVGPDLLDALWVRISPERAYERAGEARHEQIEALERTDAAQVAEAARTWLRSRDPLAAAGILRAIDFASDENRKLALLRALDATPTSQLAVVDLLADEAGMRADDMPNEALALARALLAVDRASGVRLLSRILARATDGDLKRRALALRTPHGADDERAPSLSLTEALEDGRPGPLFLALLAARPTDVTEHAAAVRALFREEPFRLRAAAAVALLGARLPAGGRLAPTLWEAVMDPLEGPEVRAAAVRHLGEDPGWNEEVWTEAIGARLEGGR